MKSELIIRRNRNYFELGYLRNKSYFSLSIMERTEQDAIKAAREFAFSHPNDYFFSEEQKYCSFCFSELISDKLSEKYGNYCPDLNCIYLK